MKKEICGIMTLTGNFEWKGNRIVADWNIVLRGSSANVSIAREILPSLKGKLIDAEVIERLFTQAGIKDYEIHAVETFDLT